jgi:hypothetical protein
VLSLDLRKCSWIPGNDFEQSAHHNALSRPPAPRTAIQSFVRDPLFGVDSLRLTQSSLRLTRLFAALHGRFLFCLSAVLRALSPKASVTFWSALPRPLSPRVRVFPPTGPTRDPCERAFPSPLTPPPARFPAPAAAAAPHRDEQLVHGPSARQTHPRAATWSLH